MQYAYYGRNDESKPKEGVHLQMIDEHIKNVMDRNITRFKKQLNVVLVDLRAESLKEINEIKDSLKVMREKIKRLNRPMKEPKKSKNDDIDTEEYERIKKSLNKKGIKC